jgi:AraC-like DNA-binding protein
MSSDRRLVLRSDDFPERDRFSRFCKEVMRRRFVGAVVRARGKDRFKMVVDIQHAGVAEIAGLETTPWDLVRTPAHVRDGDNAFSFILCRSGRLCAVAGRNRLDLRAGDGVALDRAVASTIQVSVESSFWVITVPRTRLAGLLPEMETLAGTRLAGGAPAVSSLFGYLGGAHAIEFADAGHVTEVFANHLVDLIVLAFGARGDVCDLAEVRGVRAGRRAAILREIDANLNDPRLSAAILAHRLGITTRYVHQLFEEIGQTFSVYVLNIRLDRVAHVLREPRRANQKIAAIAFEVGFSDLSHFNRSCRRRFGETPTAARTRAMRRHEE